MPSDRDPETFRASWTADARPVGDRAQPARVHDHLLGGKDNFAPDRALGDQLLRIQPRLPDMLRAQRAFAVRAVEYLVAECGVTQFLDVGSGLPSEGGPAVHEVAQRLCPSARVVYVDDDPVVPAYARVSAGGTPQGRTAVLLADLRRPPSIVRHPELGTTLDVGRPVGLLLVGVLHHLRDADDPHARVATLVDWLPPGSHVVVAGPASDLDPPSATAVAAATEAAGIPYVPRSRSQTFRFVADLELVEPGIVPVETWHAAAGPEPLRYGWAVVARKP